MEEGRDTHRMGTSNNISNISKGRQNREGQNYIGIWQLNVVHNTHKETENDINEENIKVVLAEAGGQSKQRGV